MTRISEREVEAGQAVYTRSMLGVYDLLVLGFSNRFIWRCPTIHLLAHYDRNVSANHLDVGVGTGYLLDRCRFPNARPRLALMDLNPNCLQAAGNRVGRYRPETYRANVLEPVPLDMPKFDSVGLNYLLHCLPGTIRTKEAVFAHLKPLVNPGGVVFGSTLLHGGVRRTAAARRLMAFYNAKGIFTNTNDDLEGLQASLARHLTGVRVTVIGAVALFTGRV